MSVRSAAVLAIFEAAAARHAAHVGGMRDHHVEFVRAAFAAAAPDEAPSEWTFDPADNPWIGDHRPTYGTPVLPAAWLFDRLATVAARGRPIAGLEDARVLGWAPADAPIRFRVEVREVGGDRCEAILLAYRSSSRAGLSRFEPRARAIVRLGQPPLVASAGLPTLEPLIAPERVPNPYDNVFLGPAFQVVTSMTLGANGASTLVDPDRSQVPRGRLGVGLLDASLHAAIPQARLRWYPDLGSACFPNTIERLDFFGPIPLRGPVRVELRTRGASPDGRFSRAHMRYFGSDARPPSGAPAASPAASPDRCFLALDSIQVLFPSRVPWHCMDRFMRDRQACPGVTTARHNGETTRFEPDELRRLDWLPGTLARVYGHDPSLPLDERVLDIAIKDHVAQRLGVPPHEVRVELARGRAGTESRMLELEVEREGGEVVVRDRSAST